MKVSGGIRIDIAAADGFTVSLSKYAHSYGVTADGTLKENLDTGLIKVSVKNGKTQLICPSTTTTQPSINGTYKVTSIVMGSGMTISKSISGNQFVFWPASYTAVGQVTMNLTIVAMWGDVEYTFTQEVTFSKTYDGREGSNYIPMGWWNSSVTYSKTDLGIPLVKKADGTALGYSVYTLKVAASTPGSFILSEWDLVESADFIYMQQAYIERLWVEMLKADTAEIGGIKINANSLGVASPDPNAPSITEGIYFDNATLKLWKSASQSNKSILITSDGVELVSYSISGSYNVKLETAKITVSSNITGYGESILEIRPDGIYKNGTKVL